MASERTIQRIQAQIQRRIAHCLQFELADPRGAFVTVVRIELNNDLSVAKVHYSVLGDDADKSKSAQMLEHANGFIRRQVASILRTKTVPVLKWVFDDTIADAERLEALFEETRRKDAVIRGEQIEEEPPADPAGVPEGDNDNDESSSEEE